MAKHLVIVESPAKAKTINKILGDAYIVLSSMGHVRDLPEKSLGVDIEKNFEPTYVLVPGRKKVVAELKSAARGADAIYLAPDPDREGESIAWHLEQVLRPGNEGKRFARVQYNEITPGAVKRAFANPGEIDVHRVDAQQARRILDRLVGYRVSPLLWREITRGLSAGRVQSVALRLVCEREELIRAFKPEEYWILGAVVRKQVTPLDPFRVRLAQINGEKAEIKTSQQAEAIRADLERRSLRVIEVKTRRIAKRAPPPFITSTLQQAGSTQHGFSPSRTMQIAQRLYEGVDLGGGTTVGLITYMRTDSFNLSRDAVDACRAMIREQFGPAYCPEQPNAFRSRASAQEAHEAIRPTDPHRTPESVAGVLDGQGLKLYTLIWKRFVACQMAPAQIDQKTAEIEAVPAATEPAPSGGDTTSYLFRASASDVVFPGWLKVMGLPEERERDKDKDGENGEAGEEVERLPPLERGEPLDCLEWLADRKETKPPARFNEASLIRELERNGVGRPSTYAQILATLQARRYVARENRALVPSALGLRVNAYLVKNLGELFDVQFTARMEETLDRVEEGAVQWTRMLGEFHARLDEWLSKAGGPAADPQTVGQVLGHLERVTAWSPPRQDGKRAYSDERFVASVRDQWSKGKRKITQRQLAALLRLAARYKGQVPELASFAAQVPEEEAAAAEAAAQPPDARSLRKLELLRAVELDESAAKFVQSVGRRADSGRRLTDPQLRVVDRILWSNAAKIPDFDAVRAELGLEAADTEQDNESGPLLDLLVPVQQWRAAASRGKRVFDDRQFYESLRSQFHRRHALSPRQRSALKRMVVRYRGQIADFEAKAHALGLDVPAGRGAAAGEAPDGGTGAA